MSDDTGFAGTLPIREESRQLFNAMTMERYSENFALLSVTYDGWPTEAICLARQDEDAYYFDPVAIFVTDEMRAKLLNPEGEPLPEAA